MFVKNRLKKFLILIFALWQSNIVLSGDLTTPEKSIPETRFLTGVYISELHFISQNSELDEKQYSQLEDIVKLVEDNPKVSIQLHYYYPRVYETGSKKQIRNVLDYLLSNSIEPHDIQALPLTTLPDSESRLEIWLAGQ